MACRTSRRARSDCCSSPRPRIAAPRRNIQAAGRIRVRCAVYGHGPACQRAGRCACTGPCHSSHSLVEAKWPIATGTVMRRLPAPASIRRSGRRCGVAQKDRVQRLGWRVEPACAVVAGFMWPDRPTADGRGRDHGRAGGGCGTRQPGQPVRRTAPHDTVGVRVQRWARKAVFNADAKR